MNDNLFAAMERGGPATPSTVPTSEQRIIALENLTFHAVRIITTLREQPDNPPPFESCEICALWMRKFLALDEQERMWSLISPVADRLNRVFHDSRKSHETIAWSVL